MIYLIILWFVIGFIGILQYQRQHDYITLHTLFVALVLSFLGALAWLFFVDFHKPLFKK